MVYVSNPAEGGFFVHGIVAFRVDANCNLSLAWQTRAGVLGRIGSTPTVANGVVYWADGAGKKVRAFNAQTGQALWTSGAEVLGGIYAAPVVIDGKVFAGSYDNHLHAWGL
jgi:outer membrane protein assembly factor BamB